MSVLPCRKLSNCTYACFSALPLHAQGIETAYRQATCAHVEQSCRKCPSSQKCSAGILQAAKAIAAKNGIALFRTADRQPPSPPCGREREQDLLASACPRNQASRKEHMRYGMDCPFDRCCYGNRLGTESQVGPHNHVPQAGSPCSHCVALPQHGALGLRHAIPARGHGICHLDRSRLGKRCRRRHVPVPGSHIAAAGRLFAADSCRRRRGAPHGSPAVDDSGPSSLPGDSKPGPSGPPGQAMRS